MADRPILFTGEMVRAILDGRKTQTRRVIKPQPDETEMCPTIAMQDVESPSGWIFHNDRFGTTYIKSLKGVVGDRLWVRETFWYCCEGCKIATYRADGEIDRAEEIRIGAVVCKRPKFKWKPSIHMPKWAARLWLEITGVRVERIQEITAAECCHEGIYNLEGEDHYEAADDAYLKFQVLWDSINAKPKPVFEDKKIAYYVSYPWEEIRETRIYRGKKWYVYGNPWVWQIEFRKGHDLEAGD